MKTPFCEVYVARGFCRLKPLETRPNVCLTIITVVTLDELGRDVVLVSSYGRAKILNLS